MYCFYSRYQNHLNYLLALRLLDCFIVWSLTDCSFLIVIWIRTLSYTFNNEPVLKHMIVYVFFSQSMLLIQWNLQLCRLFTHINPCLNKCRVITNTGSRHPRVCQAESWKSLIWRVHICSRKTEPVFHYSPSEKSFFLTWNFWAIYVAITLPFTVYNKWNELSLLYT